MCLSNFLHDLVRGILKYNLNIYENGIPLRPRLNMVKQAINVASNFTNCQLHSRQSLLAWFNDRLQTDIQKIDDLCSGAAYCCAMDILFPNSIQMRKVKFAVDKEEECVKNFEILQHAFNKHGVKKIIPIESLAKGKFKDNYDFAVWFRVFYDANFQKMPDGYDVELKRYNQDIVVTNCTSNMSRRGNAPNSFRLN